MQNICFLIGLFLLYSIRVIQTLYCPINCDCKAVIKAICTNGYEFPRGFNFTLLTLTVSNIKTEHLRKESIDKDSISNLLNLTITSCQIQRIDDNVFHELHGLQYLDLSYNNISDFNIDLFKTNKKLQILKLDSNPLQIRRDIFLRLPSLKVLSLANCSLSEIPPTFFSELPRLSVLNLTDNDLNLLTVYTFMDFIKLRKIDLRRNKWYCDIRLVSWYQTINSTLDMQVCCTFLKREVCNTDLRHLSDKHNHTRKAVNKISNNSTDVIDTSSTKLSLSTLEAILIGTVILLVLATASSVWLAIFKGRHYRRVPRDVELVVLNQVVREDDIQPGNLNLHFRSEMSNKKVPFPLDSETYIESASSTVTSQGYLVPRDSSDYHVYEEIE